MMVMNTLDFIAIGPPKSGTTYLQFLLIQHPEIFLSEKKEIQFFNYHYENGIAWYHNHFSEKNDIQKAGEISPTYCDSFETLEKLKAYAKTYSPGLKIIFTYRDPK